MGLAVGNGNVGLLCNFLVRTTAGSRASKGDRWSLNLTSGGCPSQRNETCDNRAKGNGYQAVTKTVHSLLLSLPLLLLMCLATSGQTQQGIVVQDIFGRTINTNGLTLVDWDGYIANPAIRFFVLPPS